VATALEPRAAIENSLVARMQRPGHVVQRGDDRLAPFVAAPSFPAPLMPALATLSQAWVLPGIESFPANSVAILEPNQRFVEAFLAGANHELARQLLWSEFPADPKATFFFNFWDGRPKDAPADILPMDQWKGPLGGNAPPGAPAGTKDRGLMLLLRADLLHRFPGAHVFAVRAEGPDGKRVPVASTAPKDRCEPSLRGDLSVDISFLLFPSLSFKDVRASPGWFFVLQEPSVAPRFGLEDGVAPDKYLDVGAPPPSLRGVPNAAQLASSLVRQPVRLAIHASLLLPGANP
jgi:hypothetical protein